MPTKDPWEWLSLVDVDGPFLSRAALKSVFPNGLDRPYNAIDDVNSTFVYEHTLWSKAWTASQGRTGVAQGLAWRDRWVTAVLRDLLQWGDYLDGHPDSRIAASSPDGDVTVRPWAALDAGDGPAALVVVVDPTDDLRRTGADGWAADAIDRTAALLREAKVSVGLVTDGRWWGIVSAVPDVTTASGVFDSLIWREERDSRDAFLALGGLVSLAGGAAEKRLPKLFELSVASAEAITEALGDQVRRAVELILQAMSESHLRAIANGEESPLPENSKEVYEAAVSVLMRIVFLLFAEERALLPQHQMYRDSYAISGVLSDLEHQAQNDTEEALDHTWETWHRLLAASSAIFSGATFEDTRMPAYGGSLFDPARFPWLRAINTQAQLSVRVSDRVMLHVLKAVQTAHVGGERRQLSFRDLDVEQIGYVYEGLLGYSAEYTHDVVVGLTGKSGYEPEIALDELRALAYAATSGADFAKKLIVHLGKTQPNAKPATPLQIAKAFEADDESNAADARTRLGFVLLGHTELVDQLAPLHALIRNDLRDFPYVVAAGGLVMTESPQRANTGTHYTPRSLAEEVVQNALEPLVYSPGPLDTETFEDWVLKSSTEILNLKVADIAAGSGAFLVAAAHYLAKRLIEARSKEGLTGNDNEESKRWATREVVARCLYGADINGMAVEMCKLSLWLVSMDPGKPFSFVDDRVFHGNSLLGVTSERQLRAQHIDPNNSRILQRKLLQLDVDGDLARAAQLRRELSSGQVDDVDRARSTRAKRRLLDESRQVTARLRDVADGVIAAGLREGGRPGKALDGRYEDLADALFMAYPVDGGDSDRDRLDTILEAGLTPAVDTGEARWKPLHWVIEAPDVIIDHKGFDAIIGNPPFLVGKDIPAAVGDNVREFLLHRVASGERGKADLAAYFIRRSPVLLNDHGILGVIAPKAIAEGVTRTVGLDPLVPPWTVLHSTRSVKWPTRSASTRIAKVTLSARKSEAAVLCEDQRVRAISSTLDPVENEHGRPKRLSEKIRAYKGSGLQGDGFLVPASEAQDLLADAVNQSVLRPYINGTVANRSFEIEADDYAIDFREMTESEARSFPQLWEIISTRVRPERLALSVEKYPRLVNQWWKHSNSRPEMYENIRKRQISIAISAVSKHAVPVLVPTDAVLSSALVVFDSDDPALYALLSSNIHRIWLLRWGSTMQKDLRYAISDVWKTFPVPALTAQLSVLGNLLLETRLKAGLEMGLGPTGVHSLVDDPSCDAPLIRAIREQVRQIDRQAADTFGWGEGTLGWDWVNYRNVVRYGLDLTSRAAVLERLLEENHRRAALEAQSGRRPLDPMELDFDPQTAPEGAMF